MCVLNRLSLLLNLSCRPRRWRHLCPDVPRFQVLPPTVSPRFSKSSQIVPLATSTTSCPRQLRGNSRVFSDCQILMCVSSSFSCSGQRCLQKSRAPHHPLMRCHPIMTLPACWLLQGGGLLGRETKRKIRWQSALWGSSLIIGLCEGRIK